MMELNQITAGYGTKDVVKNVSLCFESGKVTVLVGPNGCGKSTLLRVAARLLEPRRGNVVIDGTDTASWSNREFAKKVALLPQVRPVPEIGVGSLVLHGRFPYLGYPRRYSAEDRTIAEEAMRQAGVLELSELSVSQLSGGQRQKVYLAMAMAQDTPILLLDEPTTYLDINHQLELAHLAKKLAQTGKEVIMVLHDLNLALGCADTIVVMNQGQLMGTGSPQQVYESKVLDSVFGVTSHCVTLDNGQVQYLFTREF